MQSFIDTLFDLQEVSFRIGVQNVGNGTAGQGEAQELSASLTTDMINKIL